MTPSGVDIAPSSRVCHPQRQTNPWPPSLVLLRLHATLYRLRPQRALGLRYLEHGSALDNSPSSLWLRSPQPSWCAPRSGCANAKMGAYGRYCTTTLRGQWRHLCRVSATRSKRSPAGDKLSTRTQLGAAPQRSVPTHRAAPYPTIDAEQLDHN